MLKRKSKEWLKRYLPSEIAGTVTALTAACTAQVFCENPIIIAYIATVGEAIGFYSTVFTQHILVVLKTKEIENKTFILKDFAKIASKIILEYGLAGVIDGLLLRPLFMYLFPILLHNFMLGILAGKIAGDITFYILVIISYELSGISVQTDPSFPHQTDPSF
jgi:hypothetical protein